MGGSLCFAPSLKVTHFTAPSLLGLLRIMRAYGRGTAQIAKKHRLSRHELGLCPCSLIGLVRHLLRHCASMRLSFSPNENREQGGQPITARTFTMAIGCSHNILPKARYQFAGPSVRHLVGFPLIEVLREVAFQIGGMACPTVR